MKKIIFLLLISYFNLNLGVISEEKEDEITKKVYDIEFKSHQTILINFLLPIIEERINNLTNNSTLKSLKEYELTGKILDDLSVILNLENSLSTFDEKIYMLFCFQIKIEPSEFND